MLLGISILKDGVLNDEKIYTKPFINSFKEGNETLIFQIISSNDCAFLLTENSKFFIELVLYRTKNEYYELNLKKKEPFKILGKYVMELNNNTLDPFHDTNSYLRKELDNEYKLNIQFSVVYRHNEKDYILTTPTITCNKTYMSIN